MQTVYLLRELKNMGFCDFLKVLKRINVVVVVYFLYKINKILIFDYAL